MFGLIKSLISVALLFAIVAVGIGFFAPSKEQQKELGSNLAGLAVKGCRGGQILYNAFMKEVKERKDDLLSEEDARAEEVAAAGSVDAEAPGVVR